MLTIDEEAVKLAEIHYQDAPPQTRIYHIHGATPIRSQTSTPAAILEVTEFTAPMGVMPLGFGPDPDQGLRRPSVVIQITPEEFERIQSGELKLPEGWTVGDLIPDSVSRHETNGISQ